MNRVAPLSGALFSALGLLACSPEAPPAEAATPALSVTEGKLEVAATVHAEAFERQILGVGMPGYHLAVWGEGKAAGAALFRTRASDTEVLEALEGLGLAPGNGLGMASWEERGNPAAAAPDQVIVGPAVELSVRLPGRDRPLALDEILSDPAGRGFEFRFGGHRANIPIWRSGCLVCLYSCPGSKVGNTRYTVRDYENGTTTFRVRPGVLPADGSAVTLIFSLPSPMGGAGGKAPP